MTKIDTIVSLIIGFLIGLFFFISLRTLQIEIPQSWLFLIIFPPLSWLGLFLASLLGKKILAIYQLAKFLLVGALNTMVDLGILNLLMWLSGIYKGLFFSVFKGISFLVAATNSYFWNKFWTFEKKESIFVGREYFKFLFVAIIGLLINVGVATFLVNVVGPQFGISEPLWANIGAFVAVFVALTWNFLGAKFLVFKK